MRLSHAAARKEEKSPHAPPAGFFVAPSGRSGGKGGASRRRRGLGRRSGPGEQGAGAARKERGVERKEWEEWEGRCMGIKEMTAGALRSPARHCPERKNRVWNWAGPSFPLTRNIICFDAMFFRAARLRAGVLRLLLRKQQNKSFNLNIDAHARAAPGMTDHVCFLMFFGGLGVFLTPICCASLYNFAQMRWNISLGLIRSFARRLALDSFARQFVGIPKGRIDWPAVRFSLSSLSLFQFFSWECMREVLMPTPAGAPFH